MKGKGKGKMKHKGNREKTDLDKILSDSRFSHVPYDPAYRPIRKEESKVNIDSRFSSMFTDEKFHEKSSMDPRGRKENFSTKEDLHRFYRLSSDKKESDDEESDDGEKDLQNSEAKKHKQKTDVTSKGEVGDESKEEEISQEILERLQDMNQDYARGALLFSDDSSDDDSSTDEEEDEFEWGELDQDAVWDTEQDIEETSRFAVCNLDWMNIKAVDIMVVFHSFCPTGGSVKKVTIYPSEYGKQRMAEEDQHGPTELVTDGENQTSKESSDRDIDLDKLAKGKLTYNFDGMKKKYESLRRYERNRLRYYYAVVETDSVETAKVLYKQCDGQSFERAGVIMDLRYIPEEMTFDEEPHDVCDSVPEFYEAKLFRTTALFDSQPTLTWDQTDPHRQKVLSNAMKNVMSGKEYNEKALMNFIASSSEDESDPAEEEDDYSSDEEDTKNERIANFRALIQEIDEKEKKKEDRFDMEHVFGTERDSSESEEEEKSSDEKTLNPFEKYLEKKRMKKKEKREKKLKAQKGGSDEEDYSDDELPGGMEDLENDPVFGEELKKRKKEKSNRKKKTDKGIREESDEGDQVSSDKKYQDKKKMKRKELREKNLKAQKGVSDEEDYSDDEIPDDMEELENDPVFGEELRKRKKEKGKRKKKTDKGRREENDDEKDQGNLELLLMDEDQEENKHFSMREIVKDHKKRSKKMKKKQREQMEKERKSKIDDDFKIDTSDPRFSDLMKSGDYNIDPSHPQFKRTKAIENLITDVQKKRIAESYENMPESKRANTTKGREEHELSMLVKRVKNKAKKPT